MSGRYEIVGPWHVAQAASIAGQKYQLEYADLRDTRNDTVYSDGAYRVTLNGRPAKIGKGGSVPFKGESAWSDGERLYGDLVSAARHAR